MSTYAYDRMSYFIPERRNWWGNWVIINNVWNREYNGKCTTEDKAQAVLDFYALHGNGDEIVITHTRKALRAILLLKGKNS